MREEPTVARSASPPLPLEALRAAAGRHAGVELVLAFGSRVRGTANERSDLDVAVLGEDYDALALMADLAEVAGCEVDLADLRRAGYPLLKVLLRDSILVYRRDRYAEARWRYRAIYQVEDFRPYWERMRDAYLARLASEAKRSA